MKLILNIFVIAMSLISFSLPLSAQQIGELEFLSSEEDNNTYTEYHKVARGETLYQISQKYNVSVKYLQNLNDMDNYIIFPGQSLKVKTVTNEGGANKRVASRSVNSGLSRPEISDETRRRNLEKLAEEDFAKTNKRKANISDWESERDQEITTIVKRDYHQVEKGEDLISISKQYDVFPDEIKSWNGIDRVYAGQTIIVGKRYEEANINDLNNSEPIEEFGSMSSINNKRVIERSIKDLNKDAGADPEDFGQTGSLSDLNSTSKIEELNSTVPGYRKYHTSTSTLGSTVEVGAFSRLIDRDYKVNRFYAAHKTLPPGSKVSMLIPGNNGFVEVDIIRTLSPFSDTMIELSPSCLDLIDGAGGADAVTIIY